MSKQPSKLEDFKGTSINYPMPNDKVDPSIKRTLEYHLAVANSMISHWVDGKFIYRYGQQRSIQDLRDYSTGSQNMDKIKKYSTHRKNRQGRPITKQNISWEGYAKLAQMYDVVRSRNMAQEYDPDLYCIDNDSVAERERSRNVMRYILDEKTKEFVLRSQMKPNFEFDVEKLGFENQQQVDDYFDSGGFTLQWEIAALAAIQKSKTESNYKEFQDLTFDNLIVNPKGFTGARTYTDKSDGIPKMKSLDMDNVICPYFRGYDSNGKIKRAGEVIDMSLGDIAKANPSLTHAELMFIAKQYAHMNPSYANALSNSNFYSNSNVLSQNTNESLGVNGFDGIIVKVLDYQFLSIDIKKHLVNKDRKVNKEVDFSYRVNRKAEKNGDRLVSKNVMKKYEGMWIIGTKYFLNYGECEDSSYFGEDGNKHQELDFYFTKINNKSLLERSVAIVDDMNMALMKERNLWANIPAGPAMMISQHMIDTVFVSGKKMDPYDIFADFQEKGILIFNGLDEHDKPIYGVNGNKPFDYVNLSNLVGMLSAASGHMAVKVNELKELWGLQGGVDGGEMDRYQGLGQTELAFEASNASLAPTFNSYKYLFRNVCRSLIKKWQIKADKQKDLKVPYKGLGGRNMKMLALSSKFSISEFNCEVVLQPTANEKAKILNDLVMLKNVNVQSGGAAGITQSEYLYCYEKVMAGSVKECMYILAKIESKKAQALREKQIQDQQANIQSNQMQAESKFQSEIALRQFDQQGGLNLATLQGLMKENLALKELLLKPNKEGEGKVNEQFVAAVIQDNEIKAESVRQESNLGDVETSQDEEMTVDVGNMPL